MSSPDLTCFPVVVRLLVVVRDLDFVGISRLPPKTKAILIVDSDAVLPATAAAQSFKIIPRRERQVRRDPSRDSPDPASSEPPAINRAGTPVELALSALSSLFMSPFLTLHTSHRSRRFRPGGATEISPGQAKRSPGLGVYSLCALKGRRSIEGQRPAPLRGASLSCV